jgi:hypothetical protein
VQIGQQSSAPQRDAHFPVWQIQRDGCGRRRRTPPLVNSSSERYNTWLIRADARLDAALAI